MISDYIQRKEQDMQIQMKIPGALLGFGCKANT